LRRLLDHNGLGFRSSAGEVSSNATGGQSNTQNDDLCGFHTRYSLRYAFEYEPVPGNTQDKPEIAQQARLI
jgi:hypothetical protein